MIDKNEGSSLVEFGLGCERVWSELFIGRLKIPDQSPG